MLLPVYCWAQFLTLKMEAKFSSELHGITNQRSVFFILRQCFPFMPLLIFIIHSTYFGLESREYGRSGICRADHVTFPYPQKLELTSPTSGHGACLFMPHNSYILDTRNCSWRRDKLICSKRARIFTVTACVSAACRAGLEVALCLSHAQLRLCSM
jgi:hypothetical protein